MAVYSRSRLQHHILFKMAAHFVPPVIQDNPNGWGPCTTLNEFKDIPYQPFSKGDRIGKVMIIFFIDISFLYKMFVFLKNNCIFICL